MASAWHYQRNGKQVGPLSESELRALAAGGSLAPDDLVRKDGVAAWHRAGSVVGLFPARRATPTLDDPSAAGACDTPAAPADSIAALQAERNEINHSSLPHAYAVFGKAFYERSDHAAVEAASPELGTFLSQIDSLLAAVAESRPATPPYEAARHPEEWATPAAMAKATNKELRKKYALLGKRAHAKGEHPSSCKNELLTIRALMSREATVSQQIAALRQKAAARAARATATDPVSRASQQLSAATGRAAELAQDALFSTPVVCMLAVLTPPLGLLLIWRHPSWGKFSKLRWAAISLACLLSILLIDTTRHVASVGMGAVTNCARWTGSGLYDFAAWNGIVPRDKKPKWLAASAKEWVREPRTAQGDRAQPRPASEQAAETVPPPPPPANKATGGIDALNGEWANSHSAESGREMSQAERQSQRRRVRIDGQSLTMERVTQGTLGSYRGTIAVDAATGSFTWTGKGPELDAQTWIGIYEVTGDTLKLCYREKRGTNEASRPTEFRSDDQKPPALYHEFSRVVKPAVPSSSTAAVSKPQTPPPALAQPPASTVPPQVPTAPRKEQFRSRVIRQHGGAVLKVAMTSDAKQLVTGCEDRRVRLFDVDTGALLWQFSDISSDICDVAISPDNRFVWVAEKTAAKCLALESGEEKSAKKFPTGGVSLAAFDSECKLVGLSYSGFGRIFDLEAGRAIGGKGEYWISMLMFLPRTRQLVMGGFENEVPVVVYDVTAAREIAKLTTLRDRTTGLAASVDGTLLAASSGPALPENQPSRSDIVVWDIRSGKTLMQVQSPNGWAHSLCFSPDGRLLASGGGGSDDDWHGHAAGKDNSVLIWEVSTGKIRERLKGHTATPLSLAISPDGRRLVSASADQSVRVWDLHDESSTEAGSGASSAPSANASGAPRPVLRLYGRTSDPTSAKFTLLESRSNRVDGRKGKAARFNGNVIDEYKVTLPSGNAARSVALWARNEREGPSNDKIHIVNYGPVEPTRPFGLMEAGGRWRLFDYNGGLDSGIEVDHNWHHHCLTFDGIKLRYYFDGRDIANVQRPLDTTAATLKVGGLGDASNNFVGCVEELCYFDRALTAGEVTAVMAW